MREVVLKRICHICENYLPKRKSKFCSKKCFREYRIAYQRELMRKKHGWKPRIKKKQSFFEEIKDKYLYINIPMKYYVSNGSI